MIVCRTKIIIRLLYSLRSVGPRDDPSVQAVSPYVIHPAVDCHYFPSRKESPPLGCYQVIYCLVTEAHRCE